MTHTTILRDALKHYAAIEESDGFFSSVAHKALAAADAVLYDDAEMRPAVVVGEAAARLKGYNAPGGA